MERISKAWNLFWDWFFWPAWTVWVVVGSLTGILDNNAFNVILLGLAVLFWWGMAMFQSHIAERERAISKTYEKMISAGKF